MKKGASTLIDARNIQARTILSDSSMALERVFHNRRLDDLQIVTSSPFLATRKDLNVVMYERDILRSRVEELIDSSLELSVNVFNACRDNGFKDYGLLASHQVHRFQQSVRKALPLGEDYFDRPVAIIQLVLDDGSVPLPYQTNLDKMLRENKELEIISVSLSEIDLSGIHLNKNSRFLNFAVHNLDKLLDTFSNKIEGLRQSTDKGLIAVYPSRNHLLQETCEALKKNSYGIVALELQQISKAVSPQLSLKELQTLLRPIILDHLNKWLFPPAIKPLLEIYEDLLASSVSIYESNIPVWRRQLTEIRPQAVLTQFPSRPNIMALARVAKDMHIPYVSAQHGFGREIDANHRVSIATYENNVADLVLTYNDESSRVSNQNNPFRVGECVAVGLPQRINDLAPARRQSSSIKFGLFKRFEPIVYLSTMLPIGNSLMIHAGSGSDYVRASFDMDLLKEVFARLPRRVLFKAYPVSPIYLDGKRKNLVGSRRKAIPSRYLDLDPICELAKDTKNVSLYEGFTDAIDMITKHQIVVLTGCSSTIASSLVSDIPLVFMDHPLVRPMNPEIREDFDDAVFCFDALEPNLHSNLIELLSQPMELLMEQWEHKRPARTRFIEKHVIKKLPEEAGPIGAELVKNIISKYQSPTMSS